MVISNLQKGRGLLYVVLTVLCLEYVRKSFNNLEKQMKKRKCKDSEIFTKQQRLILRASLIYAVFSSFVILNFFISLTEKITDVYNYMEFLRHPIVFISGGIFSYVLSVVVVKILLRNYIDKINRLRNIGERLGRSILIQAPIKCGGKALNLAKKGTQVMWGKFDNFETKTKNISGNVTEISKGVGKIVEDVSGSIGKLAKKLTQNFEKQISKKRR